MRPVYLVGGEQKQNPQSDDEWHRHRAGKILRLDPATKTVETLVEYQSPPDVCPDEDPSFLFKASEIHGDRLLTCSSTEVLIYDFPSMELRQQISHPCFNDLHHVCIGPNGNYFVANTGLDMTVELSSTDGEIVRQWSVLEGKDVWHRFSPDIDYRKVPTTKPHDAHPNFTFFLGDDVWSTRGKLKDAVCLTTPGQRIAAGDDRPIHDGIVTPHGIYFTWVDAHLARVNPETLQREDVWDLAKMMSGLRRPGWCRGLHVVDDDRFLVAFTRMRPTKWQNNVSWASLRELKALYRMPARVCLFNVRDQRTEWEFDLQDVGMTTVFSIHEAPETEVSQAAA